MTVRRMFIAIVVLPAVVMLCGLRSGAAEPVTDLKQSEMAEADLFHSDADTVERTVREVLSDPEFRHLQKIKEQKKDNDLPEWLENFLKWLFGGEREERETTDPLLDFGDLFYYLAMAALVIVVIVMAASLFRWIRQQPRSHQTIAAFSDEEAIMPTHPAGDLPVNEYERRALSAFQAEDYRSALRELVLGAMSWTERAGLIRYRRGLTNREYVRAVWSHESQRDSLLKIVLEFERVFYGNRAASRAVAESCLREFRQSFLLEANRAVLEN